MVKTITARIMILGMQFRLFNLTFFSTFDQVNLEADFGVFNVSTILRKVNYVALFVDRVVSLYQIIQYTFGSD